VNFAEVYIDESGSHDGSPVLSVGGYVFEKTAALEFDRDRKVILDAAGLPYFRMSACAHLMEPFEKKTVDEADKIERALIRLTREKSLYGFVVALNEEDYKTIGPKHEGLGTAYSFCLRQCLIAVRFWINSSNFAGKSMAEPRTPARVPTMCTIRSAASSPTRYRLDRVATLIALQP
jgi:hypothetical protein